MSIAGWIDGNANCDSRAQTLKPGDYLCVAGWAAADSGNIVRVDIYAGSTLLGSAQGGGDRPDVAAALGRPDWEFSGWSFQTPINASPGSYQVRAIAYDTQGNGQELASSGIPLSFQMLPADVSSAPIQVSASQPPIVPVNAPAPTAVAATPSGTPASPVNFLTQPAFSLGGMQIQIWEIVAAGGLALVLLKKKKKQP